MKKIISLLFIFILCINGFANTSKRALKLKLKEMQGEQRTALVIGNSKYKHKYLKNTVNDAQAIKTFLEDRGFEVMFSTNSNKVQMEKAIKKFGKKIKKGGVGLFYYAGHGAEVEGKNYLIPLDAKIESEDDIGYYSVGLDLIIRKLDIANNRLNIVILDACRNNPFERSFSRSGSGGLSAMQDANGMYIAYATSPKATASDGDGKNGLFTEILLNNMSKTDELDRVFKNTRREVKEKTNGKQRPWTSSSVDGDFYFTLPSKLQSHSIEDFSSNFKDENQTEFKLSIKPVPKDAKVEITNINPKYYDGIALKKGNYKIKIFKKGYVTKTGEIDLRENLTVKIVLKKEKKHSTKIKDKYGYSYKKIKSPYTGKMWLDRNLGAKRVCKSATDEQCFGDSFQWGRSNDGHEKRNSLTTSSVSSSLKVKHNKFITSSGEDKYDWLTPQSKILWEGIKAKNNPCPAGFRIPTKQELKSETTDKYVKNARDAFNDFLKLPTAGGRSYQDGVIRGQGDYGYLWSSTAQGYASWDLYFNDKEAAWYSYYRATGRSIRCIED